MSRGVFESTQGWTVPGEYIPGPHHRREMIHVKLTLLFAVTDRILGTTCATEPLRSNRIHPESEVARHPQRPSEFPRKPATDFTLSGMVFQQSRRGGAEFTSNPRLVPRGTCHSHGERTYKTARLSQTNPVGCTTTE